MTVDNLKEIEKPAFKEGSNINNNGMDKRDDEDMNMAQIKLTDLNFNRKEEELRIQKIMENLKLNEGEYSIDNEYECGVRNNIKFK